jgi:hypothetical protein
MKLIMEAGVSVNGTGAVGVVTAISLGPQAEMVKIITTVTNQIIFLMEISSGNHDYYGQLILEKQVTSVIRLFSSKYKKVTLEHT